MKRYYIIYKGRVQGVGFRWRLMQIANKHNLTGYVKNLSNGDVVCEIQGNGVDEFLKETFNLNKDYYIRIDDYSIKELPIDEDERVFDVRF